MLYVPLGVAVEFVLLGCQDLGPSVCEQILVSFELLLLLLQAPRSGHKPSLKANLFRGILGHAEFIIAEAHLVFGGRRIVVILQISVCRLFIWADLPVFLFDLLEGRLIRIVFFFGTIWIVFFSCAGIAVAGLRAAPMMPML